MFWFLLCSAGLLWELVDGGGGPLGDLCLGGVALVEGAGVAGSSLCVVTVCSGGGDEVGDGVGVALGDFDGEAHVEVDGGRCVEVM